MTEAQIERLAEDVLDAHGLRPLPVDPLALAHLERIQLAPGDYQKAFRARIEYRVNDDDGRFYLFYPEYESRLPPPPLRFSLAHELGHFYIAEHRQYLITGQWRGSRRESVAARRLEREANWFAAALLMPRERFKDYVAICARPEPFTPSDLSHLARSVFHTSLLSTVLRYVQLNFHPCCVVVSNPDGVCFSVMSDDMKQRGFWSINHIPSDSITGQLYHTRQTHAGSLQHSGVTGTEVWFPGSERADIWEEICDLDANGRTLTYLALLNVR